MKNFLFIILLFLPLSLISQNVSLDISDPIKANDNEVFGDYETGFVKIRTGTKSIFIHVLNPVSLEIEKTVETSDLLKEFILAQVFVFNNELTLFLTKTGNESYTKLYGRSNNELFYSTVNTKSGEISEPKILHSVNTAIDVNQNTLPGYRTGEDANRFSFEVNKSKQGDHLFIKYIEGTEDFNNFHFTIAVFNKMFDLITIESIDPEIVKNFFWITDYEYISNTLYLAFKYDNKFKLIVNEKNKHSKIPFIIKKKKNENFELLRLPFEEESYTSDLIMFKLENEKVVAQCLNHNNSTKIFTLDLLKSKVNIIDEKELKLDSNSDGIIMSTNNKSNSYFSTQQYRQFASRSRKKYRFEKGKMIYNYLFRTFKAFTKTDKDGKIEFATLIPSNYGNLCFLVNTHINAVFVEYEDDNAYLSSMSIDDLGNIIDHKKLINKNDISSKLIYLYDQCIFLDENTIASYAYKKQKEDLVIKVSFD